MRHSVVNILKHITNTVLNRFKILTYSIVFLVLENLEKLGNIPEYVRDMYL